MNVIERIFCFIIGVICFVIVFRNFLPHTDKHAYAFMTALIAAFFLCCALLGESRERIACWFVAIALMIIAVEFLRQEKFSYSFTCVVIAAFFFCSGLYWVQRFVENGLIVAFNHRVNDFQQTLDQQAETNTAFQLQLASAQAAMAAQQQNITNQYWQISALQEKLNAAHSNVENEFQTNIALETELARVQTNIQYQQTAIRDVRSFVQNLYARQTVETISGTETDRVTFMDFSNQIVLLFLKLANPAITNSVQGWCTIPSLGQLSMMPLRSQANITYAYLRARPEEIPQSSFTIPDILAIM